MEELAVSSMLEKPCESFKEGMSSDDPCCLQASGSSLLMPSLKDSQGFSSILLTANSSIKGRACYDGQRPAVGVTSASAFFFAAVLKTGYKKTMFAS
jgi:hypothetical protein